MPTPPAVPCPGQSVEPVFQGRSFRRRPSVRFTSRMTRSSYFASSKRNCGAKRHGSIGNAWMSSSPKTSASSAGPGMSTDGRTLQACRGSPSTRCFRSQTSGRDCSDETSLKSATTARSHTTASSITRVAVRSGRASALDGDFASIRAPRSGSVPDPSGPVDCAAVSQHGLCPVAGGRSVVARRTLPGCACLRIEACSRTTKLVDLPRGHMSSPTTVRCA
jgi:hypothetical protein